MVVVVVVKSRAQPPLPLSHLLPASPVSSAGGSPLVLPTRCPSSDTVPLLPTLPAASPGTSIRRCAGTWKPPQSPEDRGKIPMWISEFPYLNQSPPHLCRMPIWASEPRPSKCGKPIRKPRKGHPQIKKKKKPHPPIKIKVLILKVS